tara:strand:- start:861 stop:2039 length:1179 start_codon:yes stop_codon:yes gene_type:complete
METIVLQDNEILKDQVYGNLEFDVLIKVVGDNVVIDNILVYSPVKDFHRMIQVSGKNCTIKNCRFQDISVNGACIVVEHEEESNYCVIQDCLFMNRTKTDKNNGLEMIRLGESKTSQMGEGRNIIINNRFENLEGEIEIISVKNNRNIIVNNELVNSAGTFTLRHGKNSIVAFNYIDGKMKTDSGGIRVVDTGHIVKGNVIQNIKGDGLRAGVSLMCGIKDSPLNRYFTVEECTIAYNYFMNCENALSLGMQKKEANIRPQLVTLVNNKFELCKNEKSKHKDSVGCESEVLDNYNPIEFVTKPVEFSLKPFDDLYEELVRFNYETEEQLEEKEEPEPEPEVCIGPRMVDIDIFTTKLTKKLKMMVAMKKLEKIKLDMANNLKEFKLLIEELK